MIAGVVPVLLLVSAFSAWAQEQPSREEGLAYIVRDGPARGADKAPVTLIEFSDFQCGFCRRFWKDTLPLIDQRYIQTGKVRFLYHHFAILGKPSMLAAQASECANEQGKFWPYHDKLFAHAATPFAFAESKLKTYAKEIGLETAAFDRCLETARYASKVEAETAMAALLGVRGTPGFLINERFLSGAQPFEVFAGALDAELKKTASPARAKP
ncbi:MAG TPA: thioredoxin domain-containing protein [Candidatus Acidoferrales bacterium]|nr:thioredoxin domain-containing protein [Candidatus Acidoferrales bacterium]